MLRGVVRFEQWSDGDVHLAVAELPGDRPAQSLGLFPRGSGDFHAQQQPPVDAHLFDIPDVDSVQAQDGEDPFGDARSVLPGDGHQVWWRAGMPASR